MEPSAGSRAGSKKKAGIKWSWRSSASTWLQNVPDVNVRLTGHTRSSAVLATLHPAAGEAWPNLHWSPAKVDTTARPWYENWLGWCPTSSKYWRKNSASVSDSPGIELGCGRAELQYMGCGYRRKTRSMAHVISKLRNSLNPECSCNAAS